MVWLGWGRIPFVRLEWPVVGTSLEALSSLGTSSLAWCSHKGCFSAHPAFPLGSLLGQRGRDGHRGGGISFFPESFFFLLKKSSFLHAASLVTQMVKNPPAVQETQVRSLGREDPLKEGHGNPFQYSCLEKPMNRGAWRATARWGHKESDTAEWLSYPTFPEWGWRDLSAIWAMRG